MKEKIVAEDETAKKGNISCEYVNQGKVAGTAHVTNMVKYLLIGVK